MFARVALGAGVVAALALLLGLGTWQLGRLAWKEALIAAATERPAAAAVAAPGPADWPDLDVAAWDYRRVRLDGHFVGGTVSAWTALAEPKGRYGGPGVFVVQPFALAGGGVVLVNRGFVPEAMRRGFDPAPPAGDAFEGIVRRDDRPSAFTPPPDIAARVVYSRDIVTMARLLGASDVAPYTVDLVAAETPPGGLPQAGESMVRFSNNHLQYALTWYGIAAALAGIVAAALWRRRRDSAAAAPDPR